LVKRGGVIGIAGESQKLSRPNLRIHPFIQELWKNMGVLQRTWAKTEFTVHVTR